MAAKRLRTPIRKDAAADQMNKGRALETKDFKKATLEDKETQRPQL